MERDGDRGRDREGVERERDTQEETHREIQKQMQKPRESI